VCPVQEELDNWLEDDRLDNWLEDDRLDNWLEDNRLDNWLEDDRLDNWLEDDCLENPLVLGDPAGEDAGDDNTEQFHHKDANGHASDNADVADEEILE